MTDLLTISVLPGELSDGEFKLELDRFELHPAYHVPTYRFRMVHMETREVLGNIRPQHRIDTAHRALCGPYRLWCSAGAPRGHRYAARALRLLLPLARQLNLNPLWIACNPENVASR